MSKIKVVKGYKLLPEKPLTGSELIRPISGPITARGSIDYEAPKDSLKGKFTLLSVASYLHTSGCIKRMPSASIEIGYCNENPVQVLKKLFPVYNITCFNGYEFFSSKDFERTTPMIGLKIDAIKPIRGINGKLEDLLASPKVRRTKRKTNIPEEEVERISQYILHGDPDVCSHESLSPEYEQGCFDKNKITEAIRSSLR